MNESYLDDRKEVLGTGKASVAFYRMLPLPVLHELHCNFGEK